MTTNTNTRELVLDILVEVNEKNQYSHLVIRSVLDKYQYLDKSERAFITRLSEGTLEHMLELDFIINAFSKVKVKKMKPLIRNLMRMSVYQIKYMDSIPDSAVCNEAVKLAKKRGFGQLSGFVNGVLRNVARNIADVKYPDAKTEPLAYLEIVYSMPSWIVTQWYNAYGFDKTESLLKEFQKDRPITIRCNRTKVSPDELRAHLEAEGVTVKPVEKLDYAFAISGYDHLNALNSFENGEFYVQDISSMMVAETAQPKEGDYVIDVCAAPGGKATHMAELLNGTGMVEARDVSDYKVFFIEENINRNKLTNMKAVCQDATVFDKASVDKADVLVCDLPCSGLGVMGKKNDIRYKMTQEKQQELVALQRDILATVHRYVKAGGTLIYSTCTIHQGENEENVAWIQKNYPEFELISAEQMLPGEDWNDGFFIAKFKRRMNE